MSTCINMYILSHFLPTNPCKRYTLGLLIHFSVLIYSLVDKIAVTVSSTCNIQCPPQWVLQVQQPSDDSIKPCPEYHSSACFWQISTSPLTPCDSDYTLTPPPPNLPQRDQFQRERRRAATITGWLDNVESHHYVFLKQLILRTLWIWMCWFRSTSNVYVMSVAMIR